MSLTSKGMGRFGGFTLQPKLAILSTYDSPGGSTYHLCGVIPNYFDQVLFTQAVPDCGWSSDVKASHSIEPNHAPVTIRILE